MWSLPTLQFLELLYILMVGFDIYYIPVSCINCIFPYTPVFDNLHYEFGTITSQFGHGPPSLAC